MFCARHCGRYKNSIGLVLAFKKSVLFLREKRNAHMHNLIATGRTIK
jgi:hypothetical protein